MLKTAVLGRVNVRVSPLFYPRFFTLSSLLGLRLLFAVSVMLVRHLLLYIAT